MSAVMGENPKPHVFVGGNHDSAQTFNMLRKLRNTRLPDEGVVKVAGLTILGQSDPSAKSKNALVTPRYELDRAKRKLLARYNKLGNPPDINLVHSPRIAKAFLGKAPIVVNGDDHRLHVEHVKGSAWIDPGTTGASGIRYFKNGSPEDVTAVVLYVSKNPKVHAIAADLISIQSPKGEFFVQRKRFSVEGNAVQSALNNRNN
jgi:predicted phosphodiesterase